MKLYLTKEVSLTLEGGDFDPSSIEADIRDVKQDMVENANLDMQRSVAVEALEDHRSKTDIDIAALKAKPDNVFDATEVIADIAELKARPLAADEVNIKPLEDKIKALEDRVIPTMPDLAPLQTDIDELKARPQVELAPVEYRLHMLEQRDDYDDTTIKEDIAALQNKPDNDTVFDDSTLKLSHNSLVEHVRANTVQIYRDEIEFLNADSSFGFIRDNYFNKRAMVERMNDRAYDAMSNTLIGMSVGIDAKAKLQLTYKEDSKPDELKSFVPICRSNVIGTTLTPDDKDVFWAEWYSDSDNQSNYVIYRQDGVLVLAQWIGNKASSIQELFDKLTVGGDVSSDIAVVHKLNETLENEYIASYNDDDKYNLLKSGNYLYKVQNTEFSLDISYTGIANNNLDGDVVGYYEPDPVDIMTDPSASDLILQASFDGSFAVGWIGAPRFKPVGYYYLDQPQGTYNKYYIKDSKTLEGNKHRLVAWATDNNNGGHWLIPLYNGMSKKWSMIVLHGFRGVNPVDVLKSNNTIATNPYSYKEVFESGAVDTIFEITDDSPLTYMTSLNSNSVPLVGEYSVGENKSIILSYENLPEGISIASV